jgi:hypothetical protein
MKNDSWDENEDDRFAAASETVLQFEDRSENLSSWR